MKDLTLDERRSILLDLQVMKSREVREKWSITANVLQHIRFFHGKSSAKARGYYHKDLLEGAVNPMVASIQALKASGRSSAEVAEELGLPLSTVNKNWTV